MSFEHEMNKFIAWFEYTSAIVATNNSEGNRDKLGQNKSTGIIANMIGVER